MHLRDGLQTHATVRQRYDHFVQGGAVAGKGAAFPIPVTVVPQNLSDEEIDSLA